MAQLTSVCKVRPVVDDKKIIELLKTLYGFDVRSIEELNGYDDKNYRILCYEEHTNTHVEQIAPKGYVLKIINSLDSQDEDFIKGQNEMMFYLNKHNITCPVSVMNLNGFYYSLEKLNENDTTYHAVRLLVYCPGEILYNVKITSNLVFDVGRFAAKLNEILRGFIYPPFENSIRLWNLLSVPKLRNYLFVIEDVEDKSLLQEVISCFEKNVLDKSNQLEKGMIHGDFNEHNILVDSEKNTVVGVIDFGDVQYSYFIFEVAIALCYMIIQSRDIGMGKHVIEGYQSIKKLSKFEKSILKITVCVRICQSLILGIYTHSNEPQNDYLLVTQKPGWKILRKLWYMEDDEVAIAWGI
ncbi:hydroxylysine kinase [Chelonus insularis]|uniref:hydroxylysine kinase n=1 Tax=Chelonus insularis TaxID=460826 RepID=UPI001589EFBE|nr:hydroxylysine kinase [Chelonus insularis]